MRAAPGDFITGRLSVLPTTGKHIYPPVAANGNQGRPAHAAPDIRQPRRAHTKTIFVTTPIGLIWPLKRRRQRVDALV
jgi:hypothetical protein